MNQALILIVDDEPQNLSLLSFVLKEAGYQVAVATGGTVMFEVLKKRQPDLILCDVLMPEMDGYEVCQRLKASEHQNIPLIFLTSKTQTEDLLRGFEAGAVDYITKPFNKSELLARVHTHTQLKQAQDTILAYAEQLRGLNQHLTETNQQLEALNQEKNHFLGIAAHDLRNPLTTIMLTAELVKMRVDKLEPDKIARYMQNVFDGAERMSGLIKNLLDVNRIESGKLEVVPQRFDLKAFMMRLKEQHQQAASQKQIELFLELPAEDAMLDSDENILLQIAENLLSNAIKYSPKEQQVLISVQAEPEHLHFRIQDQGPGFTAEDQNKLFQKFARLSVRPTAGEQSTGLGLSIVKLLCEALQGRVECQSTPGQGSTFIVTLPRDWQISELEPAG